MPRGFEIAHNHVRDCGDNGILVWRSEAGEDGTIVTSNSIERIAAKSGGSGQNGNAINVFRAGSVLVSGNRIADCAYSAIRSNSGSNCQMIGNSCARLGEVALYAEFSFEGAVIASNVVDKAATGIAVTNFNEGGRLAVVQGNLIRNLNFRKDVDPRGNGIAIEADGVVTGNVIENAQGYGIVVGWRNYLRDLNVTDNLIRNAHIGIGVSIDPSAGMALIANNMISEPKDGAIRAMDGPTPIGPDLAKASASAYKQPRGPWQRLALSARNESGIGIGRGVTCHRIKRALKLGTWRDPPHACAPPIADLVVELIGKRRPRLRQQRGNHFGERALCPALRSVVDLHRDAKPERRQRRAMHALGAAFDEY